MRNTTFTIALLCAGLVLGSVAPSTTAELPSGASIGNALPVIANVDVPASVSPEAGTTKEVAVTITAADDNGWQDLSAVRVTIEDPSGATHVTESTAVSNGDGSGVSETYDHAFDMDHYDTPGTYTVVVVAEDAQGALSSTAEETFVYEELAALSIAQASLSFGTVDPGVRSDASQLTVQNEGNVDIDLETSGTPLAHTSEPVEIAVDRVKYDLDSDAFNNEQSLSATPFVNEGFALAPGASSTAATHWALDVPSGDDQYIPAGSYEGTVTVSAVKS